MLVKIPAKHGLKSNRDQTILYRPDSIENLHLFNTQFYAIWSNYEKSTVNLVKIKIVLSTLLLRIKTNEEYIQPN